MKLLIEIGYVMLALLLLALIFVSFDYSFMESVFLGTLFLPGAFFLKFFIPQLALSHGKKRIADAFFLSMSVILFTFLLMVVSHLYIIPVSKFKQIWVNPIFTALILGLIAGGDMLMQRFRSRLSQKIPETISFVSDRRKVSLNVDDIVYVESNDRDVYIHASDGATYRNKTPISQWENTLGEKFIRTHRAFLVNAGYIGGIGDESVCVKDEKIPVSRKYKDEVSRKIKDGSASYARTSCKAGQDVKEMDVLNKRRVK